MKNERSPDLTVGENGRRLCLQILGEDDVTMAFRPLISPLSEHE
jgi:hypothetical protein